MTKDETTPPEAMRPEDTWPEWLRDRPSIPLYAIQGPERWRLFQGVLLGGVSTALLSAMLFAERIVDEVVLFAAFFTLVGGIVVRSRQDRRVSVAGAALAIGGLAAIAPFIAGDLLHPESWGSFMPAALVVVGVVASTGSAAAALRGVPSALVPTMVLAAIAACSLVVASSLVAALLVTDDGPRPGDRFLLAARGEFTPSVALPADTGLLVTNDDMVRHTFVIQDTDVRVELPATKTRRIQVTLPPGEYRYFCDIPGHEMEGTLTVR